MRKELKHLFPVSLPSTSPQRKSRARNCLSISSSSALSTSLCLRHRSLKHSRTLFLLDFSSTTKTPPQYLSVLRADGQPLSALSSCHHHKPSSPPRLRSRPSNSSSSTPTTMSSSGPNVKIILLLIRGYTLPPPSLPTSALEPHHLLSFWNLHFIHFFVLSMQ